MRVSVHFEFDFQLFQESALFTKFLPMVTSTMVDDQIRAVNLRMPEDGGPPKPPPDLFVAFIKENTIASLVALYYVLQVYYNTSLKDFLLCGLFFLNFHTSQKASVVICGLPNWDILKKR